MNNCIVLIPIYKRDLSLSEEASLRQCLVILKNYNITIFTYEELDMSIYNEIAEKKSKKLNVEYFKEKYFKTIEGYNELCFLPEFYERFQQYEFMLIYQLDAWVFRDELKYWCEKKYDYLGAPIFWAYNSKKFTNKVAGIGNGGFSLRKISYCLKMLDMPKKRPYLKPHRILEMYYNYLKYDENFKPLLKKFITIPLVILKFFGVFNTLNYYMRTKKINEDMVFGTNAKYAWGGNVNLPSNLEAMKFSFEVNPEITFNLIGDRLPFGCHAFEKWSYEEFWSNHIKF